LQNNTTPDTYIELVNGLPMLPVTFKRFYFFKSLRSSVLNFPHFWADFSSQIRIRIHNTEPDPGADPRAYTGAHPMRIRIRNTTCNNFQEKKSYRRLKGQSHKIFDRWFFRQTKPLGPLIYGLKRFRI
jgi:hypothetical protein